MLTKKKSELVTVLDDLRNQDPKRRLTAIADLKEVAAAIGPSRVRSELIGFLAEFLDDEESIVMALLEQLEEFTTVIGGQEHEKSLVPLLMAFCKTDQLKPSLKACSILRRILSVHREVGVEVVRKLMKTDMVLSKQCAVQLIVVMLPLLEAQEGALVEQYSSLVVGDNPQHKIICAKYLHEVLPKVKGKEEIGKLLETIYNQGDDLAKIYALRGLVQYYDINPNMCLTKFKNLAVLNSWRINIKICELIDTIAVRCTRPHFKLIFQPTLLKFMTSAEPELRAASCRTLAALASNMTEEQQKAKFLNGLKKLSVDPVDYVKVEFAKNIVLLCSAVSKQLSNDHILPMVYTFFKEGSSEISVGVAGSLSQLAKTLSKEQLQEKVIKPLLKQLSTENWRIKCQIIQILRGCVAQPGCLTQNTLKVFFTLVEDRIDAVRLKTNDLLVDIIKGQSKDWVDQNVMPKLATTKENSSYLKRQNLLSIIEKTSGTVSDKTLKELYQGIVASCLSDKVPNVRVKTMQVLKSNSKLNSPAAERNLQKLKEDKDIEVREVLKKLRA